MGRFQRKFIKRRYGMSPTELKKFMRAWKEERADKPEEDKDEDSQDDPDSGEGDQEHG